GGRPGGLRLSLPGRGVGARPVGGAPRLRADPPLLPPGRAGAGVVRLDGRGRAAVPPAPAGARDAAEHAPPLGIGLSGRGPERHGTPPVQRAGFGSEPARLATIPAPCPVRNGSAPTGGTPPPPSPRGSSRSPQPVTRTSGT